MPSSPQSVSTPEETDVLPPPPIFIGGAGRSGTSLVRSILNAHPNICIGVEFKIVPIIAKTWSQVRQHEPLLEEHFFLSSDDISDAFRQLISSLLKNYWERRPEGCTRIGEKTPNNVFFFPHLHHLFPESPLVHVVRDGRDVVRSLLQQDWSTPSGSPHPITQSAHKAAAYWKQAVTAGRRSARGTQLRDRYIEIRYEALVSRPEPICKALFSCLGERWDPSVLHFYDQGEKEYAAVQRKITPRSVGRWRQGLTGAQKQTVKNVAGDLLIELGYAEDNDW